MAVVDVPDFKNARFVDDLAKALAGLPAAERALCERWAARRQATFAAGRFALRAALVAAGVVVNAGDVGPVGRDYRGAPVLPPLAPAVRVSLTHKDTVAAAVVYVGAVDVPCCIGLDLEIDDGRTRASTDKLAKQVLLDDEIAALSDDDVRRRRQLFERFSLKEALYKGLDPFVRRYVGFLEVNVVVDGDGRARFAVPRPGFVADGRVLRVADDDVVLTMARVRQVGVP